MNERKKIELNTTIMDTIIVMSEGNPGAMRVLAEIIKASKENVFLLLSLDDMNIRGWQVWYGYKDYCRCDLDKFIECVRNRDSKMVDMINEGVLRMKVPVRAVYYGTSFDLNIRRDK